MNTEIQDILRGIRKEFFAFRNGIVADKLRKAGDPHPMIMGCLLVDIQAIAMRLREEIADNDKLRALAEQLWGDTNSRECRLAAPMLYPAHEMTQEKALLWCGTVETVEVADNLCHKLLRHLGEAPLIYKELIKRGRPTLTRYTGYRLLRNLLAMGRMQPAAALKAALEAKSATATGPLAPLLKDILEDLAENA